MFCGLTPSLSRFPTRFSISRATVLCFARSWRCTVYVPTNYPRFRYEVQNLFHTDRLSARCCLGCGDSCSYGRLIILLWNLRPFVLLEVKSVDGSAEKFACVAMFVMLRSMRARLHSLWILWYGTRHVLCTTGPRRTFCVCLLGCAFCLFVCPIYSKSPQKLNLLVV